MAEAPLQAEPVNLEPGANQEGQDVSDDVGNCPESLEIIRGLLPAKNNSFLLLWLGLLK